MGISSGQLVGSLLTEQRFAALATQGGDAPCACEEATSRSVMHGKEQEELPE